MTRNVFRGKQNTAQTERWISIFHLKSKAMNEIKVMKETMETDDLDADE